VRFPGAEHLENPPARRLLGPIHFCNLDCPDAVLAQRLRGRPAWRASSTEAKIVEHQRFAAWLRANIRPTFDTSMLSTEEVADRVAQMGRAAARRHRPQPHCRCRPSEQLT
jgi:hypothetical protein